MSFLDACAQVVNYRLTDMTELAEYPKIFTCHGESLIVAPDKNRRFCDFAELIRMWCWK